MIDDRVDAARGFGLDFRNSHVVRICLKYSIVDGAVRLFDSPDILLRYPPTGHRAPDGPGAAQPIIGWGGSPLNNRSSYTVALNGAEPAIVPEPAALAMLGLSAFAVRRARRFRAR